MSLLKPFAVACAAILPTTALADWNGWYAGVTAGSVSNPEFEFTSGDGGVAELDDTNSLGGFFGRISQSGQVAFGWEFELTNMPDMAGAVDGLEFEHTGVTLDVKARVGVPLGPVLPYAVAGISAYSFDNNLFTDEIDQSGLSFGVGVDFLVTENLFVGAEYLARRPSGEVEVEIDGDQFVFIHESVVDSVSVRAGFKF